MLELQVQFINGPSVFDTLSASVPLTSLPYSVTPFQVFQAKVQSMEAVSVVAREEGREGVREGLDGFLALSFRKRKMITSTQPKQR